MAILTKGTFLMFNPDVDTYLPTEDEEIAAAKTYYTKSGATYTEVATPAVADIATYYEKIVAGTWAKMHDITSYPDLGKDPETVDVTTLSHPQHVYIDALPDPGGVISFPGFFDTKQRFLAIKELAGKRIHLALWIGGTENADGTITPTGDKLKASFYGTTQIRLTGADVGAAVPITNAVTVGSAYIFE